MSNNPHIAVVLAGCGVFDGTEIHEATLAMLALDEMDATYQCFAPDMLQDRVINHKSGFVSGDTRHVLVESARLARGNVLPIDDYDPADFDAILFPGGFGAATVLCSFDKDGAECGVAPPVEKAILDTYAAEKPIGALCIAPVLIARVLFDKGIRVTIGSDKNVIAGIEKMGATHEVRGATEICVDEDNKIVSSPCYMKAKRISEVAASARNAVESLLELAGF